MSKCRHKIKKSFPFGKKSTALKHCKYCGEVITNHDLMLVRREKERKSKYKRW